MSNNYYSNILSINENVIGHVKLIIGPMFSGKTTLLLNDLKIYTLLNKTHVILKTNFDKRYSEISNATNHDKEVGVHAWNVYYLQDTNLHNCLEMFLNYDVICIEEAQFFQNVVSFADEMSNKYKKHLIITGLEGDINRKPFDQVLNLVPISDTITKLNGLCGKCFKNLSSFNKLIRENNAKDYSNDDIDRDNDKNFISIGSNDKYVSVCRKCWLI